MPGLKKPWWAIGPDNSEPPEPPIACPECKDMMTVDGEPCGECPECDVCGKLLAVHTAICREKDDD